MRNERWAAVAACLLGAVGFAGGASANPVVFIEWESTGTSSITASAGDTIVAEAFISAMPGQGVSAYTFTAQWDIDLGDELDLLGFVEDKPLGDVLPDLPETVTESDSMTVGSITNLDDFALTAQFTGGGTFRIAKLTFEVTANVTTDGDDVLVSEVQGTDTIGIPGMILSGVTTFLGAEVNGMGGGGIDPDSFRPGVARAVSTFLSFLFDNDGDGDTAETSVDFGLSTDTPLVGVWSMGGDFNAGVARVSGNSMLFLYDDGGDGGSAEIMETFGASTDEPFVADIDEDGVYDTGIVRVVGNGLSFRFDTDSDGASNVIRNFGSSTDTPIAGIRAGSMGNTVVGVARPSGNAMTFRWDTADDEGSAEEIITFGSSTDTPIVGDWDGDTLTDVGVVRVVGNTLSFRFDTDGGGSAEDIIEFGSSTDTEVVGAWPVLP